MPVTGEDGKVARLFGVATDETETAQNEASSPRSTRSQAVIEFGMDGKVLTANKNFLATLGYALEIRGQHHSMFVEPGRACQSGISPVLGQAWPRRIRSPASTSESPKAAAKFWSQATTIRFSTRTASRSRS